jgi:hypothetical protein
MSDELQLCVACDCVDDNHYYTPGGEGPFCGECWESLNDPDQSLLVEKRLAQTEDLLEELQDLLVRTGDALERLHAAGHEDAACDICALKRELLKETARGGSPG